MPTLLQRLKLRHKLAALSVVGVAMCLLPLIQVLRYQGLEIQAARGAELGIDPAIAAVDLQRGLVGHRDAAGRWLRGQGQAAAERRQRQAEVDQRLAVLQQTLDQNGLARAIDETQALGDDWLQLVQRVVNRQLAASESDAAHRLLVEQTLQVIDFVAQAPALQGMGDPAVAALARRFLYTLPQRTPALLAVGDPTALQAHWTALAQTQEALRERLSALRTGAERARAVLLGALLLLGLAAAWMALALAGALRRIEQAVATPAPRIAESARPDGQTDLREATLDLLAGMRDGPVAAPAPQTEPTRPAPLR